MKLKNIAKSIFAFLLFLSVSDYSVCSTEKYIKNLCNWSVLNNSVNILLNSSALYEIHAQNSSFCIFSNVKANITSSMDKNFTVSCIVDSATYQDDYPTGGIAFINSTVTIERVAFNNCGAYLTSLRDNVRKSLNDHSSLHYLSSTASALLFINSKVSMDRVTINNSYGFAAIGVNLKMGSQFSRSTFQSFLPWEVGVQKNVTIGSGLMIHFSGNMNSRATHVVIQGCQFRHNYLHINYNQCLSELYGNSRPQSEKPILSAAALTIFFAQAKYLAYVFINGSHFIQNSGTFANSLLIVHYHSYPGSVTEIKHSLFLKELFFPNTSCFEGAEVVLIHNSNLTVKPIFPFTVNRTTFTSHNKRNRPSIWSLIDLVEKRSIYINIIGKITKNSNVTLMLTNTIFENNTVNRTGVCVLIKSKFRSKVFVVLESITAKKNIVNPISPIASLSGIFTMTGVTCIIKGTEHSPSIFENNTGIVLDAIDKTNIYLYGTVIFIKNVAISGSAINIQGNSRLHFMNGLVASFKENRALSIGGAIYAVVSKIYDHCAFFFDWPLSGNTRVIFENNSAVDGGSSIYASPVFDCNLNDDINLANVKSLKPYENFFNFSSHLNSNLLDLSTFPNSLQSIERDHITVYPGQNFPISLSAKDYMNRNVYCNIQVGLGIALDGTSNSIAHIWLLYKSRVQAIKEVQKYTEIFLSLYSAKSTKPSCTKLFFYQSTANSHNVQVISSVKLQPCPAGFSLHPQMGLCVCSRALKKFMESNSVSIDCNIQDQVFTRIGNSWAGVTENGEFIVSSDCPIGDCRMDKELVWFKSTSEGIFLQRHKNSSKHSTVCWEGKEGVLCSRCTKGLSLVFGSVRCHKCSDGLQYWLFVAMIVSTGPILVIFLYLLRLTLTAGTINGISFYANIAYVGLIDLLLINGEFHFESGIFLRFLRMLNLSGVFPVCFYKDMSPLWKTGIGLTFPFYLLTLVLIIIVISRRSTWLSNKTSNSSVQVLVTIVHISFSTLLINVIGVFHSVTLYTNKDTIKVWRYDGSVKFLADQGHLLLTIAVSLMVLPLVSIYFVFLVFTKHIMNCFSLANLRFRSIYEAIHGPYKKGKEHWFAERLMIVIVVCTIRLSSMSSFFVHLITTIILCLFLIGQVLFHPYKNKALNMLDNWCILNLIIVYGGVLIWCEELSTATYLLNMTILMMFLTLLAVTVYHFLLVTGLLNKIKKRLVTKRNFVFKNNRYSSNNQPLLRSDNSFYDSCVHYKEPLLED